MRWRSWLYIFLAEVLSAALTALVGLLTNVVTNEQHIKMVVVVMIITFVFSSAVLQAVRAGIAEKRGREADRVLENVEKTTKEILETRQDADLYRARDRLNENLKLFPAIFKSWIKDQWVEESPGIERVLDALNDKTTAPSAVVIEWQQRIPDWLRNLDWRALLVAGELGNAYGASDLSSSLFLVAIEEGATREHYWRSRAALLMKFHGKEQEARQTLADGGVGVDTVDRFARIIYYFTAGDNQTALVELESWEPQAPIDILWAGMVRAAALFGAAGNPGATEHIKAVAIYRNMVD